MQTEAGECEERPPGRKASMKWRRRIHLDTSVYPNGTRRSPSLFPSSENPFPAAFRTLLAG